MLSLTQIIFVNYYSKDSQLRSQVREQHISVYACDSNPVSRSCCKVVFTPYCSAGLATRHGLTAPVRASIPQPAVDRRGYCTTVISMLSARSSTQPFPISFFFFWNTECGRRPHARSGAPQAIESLHALYSPVAPSDYHQPLPFHRTNTVSRCHPAISVNLPRWNWKVYV